MATGQKTASGGARGKSLSIELELPVKRSPSGNVRARIWVESTEVDLGVSRPSLPTLQPAPIPTVAPPPPSSAPLVSSTTRTAPSPSATQCRLERKSSEDDGIDPSNSEEVLFDTDDDDVPGGTATNSGSSEKGRGSKVLAGFLVILVLCIVPYIIVLQPSSRSAGTEARPAVDSTVAGVDTAKADAMKKDTAKKESEAPSTFGRLRDSRDGQSYKTVRIGSQTWMAENLNYETGNSWCYDNDASKCAKYGRLYDWATAKRACPEGWHLPSNGEWSELERFVGKNAGKKLESRSMKGSDVYGFRALPAGGRHYDGSFDDVGSGAYFWSSSEYDAKNAWGRYLRAGSDALGRDGYYKAYGFSVRCLKD